jgi:hypothetical protein
LPAAIAPKDQRLVAPPVGAATVDPAWATIAENPQLSSLL